MNAIKTARRTARDPQVGTPTAGMLPAWLIVGYIGVTVAIAAVGPVKYVGLDRWSVSLYMGAFLLILWVSFRLGLRMGPKTSARLRPAAERRARILRYTRICLRFSIAVYLVQLLEVVFSTPAALLPTNMGTNYLDVAETSGNYSLGILLRFASAFFRTFGLVVGLFMFREMGKAKRLVVASAALNLYVNGVVSGTQSVFGHTVIYLVAVALAGRRRAIRPSPRFVMGTALMCVAMFVLLSWVQLLRYDALDIDAYTYYGRSSKQFVFDLAHPIFVAFGERWGFAFSVLLGGYLVGGYQGLGFALKLPFRWTYGLGSSRSLSLLVAALGGPDLYEATYLNRIEQSYGRGGLSAWNSVFPWLASDLTFVGALLVFVPIGIVWGVSWREAREKKNPISSLMFATIFLGMIFVPANNQLFHGIDALISTIGVILVWFATHRAYNFEAHDDLAGTAKRQVGSARALAGIPARTSSRRSTAVRTRQRMTRI